MLDDMADRSLPPVDAWDPPYCGELDLTIRRDGVWVHEGTPMGRARLVRLFSTVLRRDGDQYFLVTPVEKLGITVEDAPFIAVLMAEEHASDHGGGPAGKSDPRGSGRSLVFTTNVGDRTAAGPDNRLEYRLAAPPPNSTDVVADSPINPQFAPYIHVRSGLYAKVARAVFYDLVALGETREVGGEVVFGVQSNGVFFSFGSAARIFDAADDGPPSA